LAAILEAPPISAYKRMPIPRQDFFALNVGVPPYEGIDSSISGIDWGRDAPFPSILTLGRDCDCTLPQTSQSQWT
jgi:hypothetical protein